MREYNFLRVEGDRQGTFTTEAKTVKFIYQPANLPPNNGAVNVRYVDETNDDLLPPVDMAGLLGDSYLKRRQLKAIVYLMCLGRPKGPMLAKNTTSLMSMLVLEPRLEGKSLYDIRP